MPAIVIVGWFSGVNINESPNSPRPMQGSNYTEIVFSVAADGTPELAEEYSLSLTSVQTFSDDISSMGRAELDPSATMATITLRASDNPHGVVEFQEMTAETEESSSLFLTVVREFGAIGQ